MNRLLVCLPLAVAIGLSGAATRAGDTGPAADTPSTARDLVQDLGLDAAEQPIRGHPRWEPRRVVVSLPPRFANDLPDFPAQLQAAAGEVELVLDRSGGFQPDVELLKGADGLIGLCSEAVLERADERLLWVHNYSVGMERCANAAEGLLADRVFTNNQRLSAPTIAEHSIAMLLAIARRLPAYHDAQAEGEWRREIAGEPGFGELGDKTLLVVGLGGIGTEVARRAHGLGMRVIATRNSSREGPDFVSYVGLPDELHKLAGEAQVVLNALPLTDETRGLFDSRFFAALPRGAIFLSVGRGKSTVTGDLVDALRSGQLYGAGLDVTDPEPLPGDSPLWSLPNVIITPHVAATGGDSRHRTALIAVENLRRYVAGDRLLNPVDMELGY